MPLIDYSKEEIINLAIELGTHLEWTWSCYSDGNQPCGKCGSCRKRLDAFYWLDNLDSPFSL